jgi:hypothetical protein
MSNNNKNILVRGKTHKVGSKHRTKTDATTFIKKRYAECRYAECFADQQSLAKAVNVCQ